MRGRAFYLGPGLTLSDARRRLIELGGSSFALLCYSPRTGWGSWF